MNKLAEQLSGALAVNLAGGRAKLPQGTSVLWNGFMSLSRARSCCSFGPNPISYQDIHAWAQLMRLPLRPHHVEAITAMDKVWMEHNYNQLPPGKGSPPALTTAAFDAVLG